MAYSELMKRYLLYIGLLWCGLVTAKDFATPWHTTIEYLQPPQQLVLPTNASQANILLVNNCMVQPITYGHATYFFGRQQQSENDSVDLHEAPFYCLMHTAATMENIYNVSVYEESKNKSTFWNGTIEPLTKSQKDQLCAEYHADILFILNRIAIYDTRELYNTDEGNDLLTASLEALYTCVWDIYDRTTTRNTSFIVKDTVYWETHNIVAQRAWDLLPDHTEALLEVAKYAGESTGCKITPQYVADDRYIYACGGKMMAQALEHFQHKQWFQAIEKWRDVAQDSTEIVLIRAYAYLNMALCYEITDDLNTAIECVKQIDGLFTDAKKIRRDDTMVLTLARSYINTLQQRIAIRTQLQNLHFL